MLHDMSDEEQWCMKRYLGPMNKWTMEPCLFVYFMICSLSAQHLPSLVWMCMHTPIWFCFLPSFSHLLCLKMSVNPVNSLLNILFK